MEQVVKDYFDSTKAASFSGASTFGKTRGLKFDELVDVLSAYPSYTLHRPVRRRFPRNRTIVGGLHHTWQVDLSDLSTIKNHNDGYTYLLIVIDVLSKQLFVEPLKRKTAAAVIDGFKGIFRRTRERPLFLMSDKGGEFLGNNIQKFFKDNNIHFYTIHDEDTKASVAERVQRTLKSKMWRYFTHQNTLKYVDVLQDLVSSYNHTHHRSIGRAPAAVTRANEVEVYHRLFPPTFSSYKFKFGIGDLVRIPLSKTAFRKSYFSGWSEEYFRIIRQLPKSPVAYHIEDLMGERILGQFYEHQLLKVKENRDEVFIVEKVLKEEGRPGRKRFLVKWRGWPDKFNSWTDRVIDLKKKK